MKNNFLDNSHLYFGDCKSKEYISSVCRDIIEDLLKETYDEENPLTTALEKCSQSTQTEANNYCESLCFSQKEDQNSSKWFFSLYLRNVIYTRT